MNDPSNVSNYWIKEISDACADPDPVSSHQRITLLHYQLSEALAAALGRECGPNFHTWAVWGSRKAGVTIRQQDLDSAIKNATITAGTVGALVGIATGVTIGKLLHWSSDSLTAAIGLCAGTATGALTGKRIAIWSRRRASALILQGNRIVIQDIGMQSARFLELLHNGATSGSREAFFAALRPGTTEQLGQDRLAAAFRLYLEVFDKTNPEARQAAMIDGNCAIVHHEHIRLQPYICGAMPWIVQRCSTERLMTYEIGEKVLAVGTDVPGSHTPTAAKNWVRIEERMRYVFALFRQFHGAPEVFSRPFPE